jgi:hypothetical protein
MYPFIQEECDARVVAGWGQTEVSGFATLIDYPAMLAAPSAIALTHFGQSLQNKGDSNYISNSYFLNVSGQKGNL